MLNEAQSTTETLEVCPCNSAVSLRIDRIEVGNWIQVVCDNCGRRGAQGGSRWMAEKLWNQDRRCAGAAPVVDNVGLNLLRQLVGGKNSLRTLEVFPCNQAEHEDVDCKCFWEQCEAWARQDAATTAAPQVEPVNRDLLSAFKELIKWHHMAAKHGGSADECEWAVCVSYKQIAEDCDAAPVEQSDSLLTKISIIADLGSAVEFGDALERLESIRKLIDEHEEAR